MSEELSKRLEKIKASQDKFEDREDGKLRMRQEAFREGYAHGYKESRKHAIDECIKALQNDLPKEELEFEQANLYAGGIHRAIYVLEKLKSEGDL